MAAMFWQVGLLIILIACVDTIIKRWAWPQLRYALWLLVLLKLVLPPGISSQGSLTVRLQPIASRIVNRVISESTDAAEKLSPTIAPESAVTAPLIVSPTKVTARLPGLVTEDYINAGTTVALEPFVRPTWQAYIMAVWMLGVFVLGSWLLFKLHILRKGHPLSRPVSALPQSFHNTMSRCAGLLKLRRIPAVVVTDKVICPAVFGVFRPVLLMPVGYLSRLSRKDAEHMVLHELAHIKRGDTIIHSVCMLLQIFYWFNPLLWLARRQMHHLRELCCDATVARLLKDKTTEYRETLMDVARRFLAKSVEPGLGLLGLFEDSNRLLVRLNWLEKKTWRYQKMKNLTVITTVVLMTTFILPMAQAEKRPPVEQNTADSKQSKMEAKEQLSQELQALRTKLQQLEADKQQLQESLAQLEQQHRDISRKQTEPDELVTPEAGTEPGRRDVEHLKLKTEYELELKKLKEEYEKELRALQEEFEEEQQELEEELQELDEEMDETEWNEQMPQWLESEDMQMWQDKIKEWTNSEEFKQWQDQMKLWKKQMKQWAKGIGKMGKAERNNGRVKIKPTPIPMPVMPEVPSMPTIPEIRIDVPVVEENHFKDVEPTDSPQAPQIQLNNTQAPKNIEVNKSENDMYAATAEMNFFATTAPNTSFVIRNNTGNIILSPGKNENFTAKAVIRAKGKTADQAQRIVEEVSINCHSSGDICYLGVTKPEHNRWKNLNVDFYVKLPADVRLDVKTNMGRIELLNLKGKIKAVTNMGSIKAVDISGDVELTTNMGDIDFVASSDISAKFKAYTNMGSIESELPLDIDMSDMMKRKAEGTVGSGEGSIRLITDMGKINIKWPPSP